MRQSPSPCPVAPRPHRLTVTWRPGEGPAGQRDCLLMTVRGIVRLNGSATAIWERLDGSRDAEAIAHELAAVYPGAAEADLRAAVDELLGELVALGASVPDWRPLDPYPVPRVAAPARIASDDLCATRPGAAELW